jgi:cbb3-type cytochrome oxidase maturation protein
MSVMFVLIAFSIVVALAFLGAFLWAVRSGQFDDKYTPSVRMLFDDPPPRDQQSDSSDLHETRSTP